MDLEQVFEDHDDEFLEFDKVENKRSSRPDIHAFILLDELVPAAGRDMVSAADHDVIWLDTDTDKLAEVATEDQIVELMRCGVLLDGDSLSMYV